MKIRYILPAIKDADEADCAIRSEDGLKSFHFKAKFGVVEVPKGDDQEMLCSVLEKNGWKLHGMVADKSDCPEKLAEKTPRVDYRRTIKLAHPDVTDDTKPTAKLTYEVDGEGVNVDVKDGVAETKNPALVRALVAKGYRVMNPHTLETEEEKLK